LRQQYRLRLADDRSLIKQLDGAIDGAFGAHAWRPTDFSVAALSRAFEPPGKGRRPVGIHMGHGTKDDTIGRALIAHHVLGDESAEHADARSLATVLFWHTQTVLITSEENKADAQLECGQLVTIPRDDRMLFCRVGFGGYRWGPAEREFVEQLRAQRIAPNLKSDLKRKRE
jgi:hypothetical protein